MLAAGRGPGEHEIALVGGHRGPAHRRDAERRVVGAAEQGRLLSARRCVHQRLDDERHLVPLLAVAAQRGVGLRAAGDVAVDRARHVPARRLLQILQCEYLLQMAGERPVDLALRTGTALDPRLDGRSHRAEFLTDRRHAHLLSRQVCRHCTAPLATKPVAVLGSRMSSITCVPSPDFPFRINQREIYQMAIKISHDSEISGLYVRHGKRGDVWNYARNRNQK